MAEIADDIINGTCCALCGLYFEDPVDMEQMYEHGYPVACKECWTPDCGYERANAETI